MARRALARRLVVAASLLMLGARPAVAQRCSISTSGLDFGAYDVFSPTSLDSVGFVSYECRVETTIQITFSKGSGNTFNERALRSGPDRLFYNLFLDAARTIVWGDGTEGTRVYIGRGTRGDVPVYGRIFAGQGVNVGAYADRIHVSIDF